MANHHGRKSNLHRRRPTCLPPWAIALFPLLITAASIHSFGSSRKFEALPKPVWFPPLWLIHAGSLCSTVLMSLAAVIVQARRGLSGDDLHLYCCQVGLSVLWCPLVVRIGAGLVGSVYTCVHIGSLLGCFWVFGKASPATRKLVGPCLGWALFVAVCTFKIVRDSEISTVVDLAKLFGGLLAG
ncbi:Translocator protein homolog [Linum grandiflorum]